MALVNPAYRSTLDDLRADLLRQTCNLLLIFSASAMYLVFAYRPLQMEVFLLWAGVAGLAWGGRWLQPKAPNTARYSLVAGLTALMTVAIVTVSDPLTPFWGLPLILLAAMLVSYGGLVVGVSMMAVLVGRWAWVGDLAYGETILAVMGLNIVLTSRIVDTLYTALLWYSAMQQRADQLLEQTREHRADLMSALKTLDIAYQTKHTIQQELIRARQQADEARKMKERFAANISHELRTPLNLILGFSEVMYMTPEVYGPIAFPLKLRRDLYQIHRSSRHLLELVDDVLDLSYIELSGFGVRLEITDLNLFLADVVEIVQGLFKGHQAQFEAHIAPDLPRLELDRTRVRQVLLNLLNNAQRFTAQGSVTLRVERRTSDVLFSVSDTGIGIPPDKLEQVFDEFYQVDYSLSRSHGGAGLGLAITKRFVEAHRGRIWVESQEGAGATFHFSLPISEYLLYWDERPAQWGELQRPYLILVESDPAIATLLRRFLPHYHLLQADPPDQLASLIETYRPLAILWNSPNGQVHPAKRDFGQYAIPMIECALPSRTWIMQQLNVRGYLAKPIEAEQLRQAVREIPGVQTILIVDDDRGFVQLIERLLETADSAYECQHAYDGVGALERLHAEKPDLLLLDLAMPGTDGFAVIEAIHQDPQLAELPIILLTATNYLEEEAQPYAHLLIERVGGLTPTEVLAALQSLLPHLHANYPPDSA
jgi:signal transduction histidine kinase/CheY-like chemotaxis protein